MSEASEKVDCCGHDVINKMGLPLVGIMGVRGRRHWGWGDDIGVEEVCHGRLQAGAEDSTAGLGIGNQMKKFGSFSPKLSGCIMKELMTKLRTSHWRPKKAEARSDFG